MKPSIRIVGLGRAGRSFGKALETVGWEVEGFGRDAPVARMATGCDLVLVCTPDDAVADVANLIEPGPAVIAHVAGSLGLEVLEAHDRRAAIHPLISLPSGEVGAERLLDEGWFAIAGHPVAAAIVDALGGRAFAIADEDRAIYHAAACVASNHTVALMGQVERLAEGIGVPAEAYVALAAASLDNARTMGAAAALTGPAARGDSTTIARHLDQLPADERATYEAMVHEARRLAAQAQREPGG
jgi:predicted short-subunit dehydrogenase-like oxidoreductase (DUF2520 family)